MDVDDPRYMEILGEDVHAQAVARGVDFGEARRARIDAIRADLCAVTHPGRWWWQQRPPNARAVALTAALRIYALEKERLEWQEEREKLRAVIEPN